MSNKIIMKRGTKSEFDALTVKDSETLYYLTDSGEIYLGSVNMSQTNKCFYYHSNVTLDSVSIALASFSGAKVGDMAVLNVYLWTIADGTTPVLYIKASASDWLKIECEKIDAENVVVNGTIVDQTATITTVELQYKDLPTALSRMLTNTGSAIIGVKTDIEDLSELLSSTRADLQDLSDSITDVVEEHANDIQTINNGLAALSQTQEGTQSQLDALEGEVDTLVGADTGKSVRTISAEEIAKIVANAPEDLDTLKEIAEFIENDAKTAAQLLVDVAELQQTDADLQQQISNNSSLIQETSATLHGIISTDLVQINNSLNDTESRVTTLEGTVASIQTTQQTQGAKVYANEQSIQEINAVLQDTQEFPDDPVVPGLISTSRRHTQEISALQLKDQTLENNIEVLEASIQQNTGSISDLQTAQEGLATTQEAHGASIEALQTITQQHTTSISEQALQITAIQDNIASLQSSTAEHEADITALQESMTSAQSSIESLLENTAQNTAGIESLDTRVTTLETQTTSLDERITAIESVPVYTESEVDELFVAKAQLSASPEAARVPVYDDSSALVSVDPVTPSQVATKSYVDRFTGIKKNYLLNPFFTINQRGITEVTQASKLKKITYKWLRDRWIADRWHVYADTINSINPEFTVSRVMGNCIRIDNSNGGNRIILRQMLDAELFADLYDKPITFSAYVSVDEGQTFTLCSATTTVGLADRDYDTGKDYINVPIPGTAEPPQEGESDGRATVRVYASGAIKEGEYPSLLAFDIYVRSHNNPLIVKWVSLTEGTEPLIPYVPDDFVELLKCQQFYQPISPCRYGASFIGATILDFTLPLPIKMHNRPIPLRLNDDNSGLNFNSWLSGSAITGYTWIENDQDLDGESGTVYPRFMNIRQSLLITIDKPNHGVTANASVTIATNALAAYGELT